MEQIAFYTKYYSVTWHALIMTFAIVSAVILLLMLCRLNGLPKRTGLAVAAMSFILSPLFSRLLYWYCCTEQYKSVFEALFSFSNSGQSLLGAMFGVLVSAFITYKLGLTDKLTRLLDCTAPAGALAIAVGRLSSAYTSDDYGSIAFEDPARQHFPVSMPVTETGTGAVMWRFPTFFYEAVCAAVICALLLVMFLRRSGGVAHSPDRTDGSVFMMFIVMFSATQIVFESTRYDALFFRSNGFVSIFQIVGAVGIVSAYLFFAVRTLKNYGKLTRTTLILYAVTVLMFTAAGIMEYLVQRHTNLYYVFYPIMFMCLILVCSCGWMLCCISEDEPQDDAAI